MPKWITGHTQLHDRLGHACDVRVVTAPCFCVPDLDLICKWPAGDGLPALNTSSKSMYLPIWESSELKCPDDRLPVLSNGACHKSVGLCVQTDCFWTPLLQPLQAQQAVTYAQLTTHPRVVHVCKCRDVHPTIFIEQEELRGHWVKRHSHESRVPESCENARLDGKKTGAIDFSPTALLRARWRWPAIHFRLGGT